MRRRCGKLFRSDSSGRTQRVYGISPTATRSFNIRGATYFLHAGHAAHRYRIGREHTPPAIAILLLCFGAFMIAHLDRSDVPAAAPYIQAIRGARLLYSTRRFFLQTFRNDIQTIIGERFAMENNHATKNKILCPSHFKTRFVRFVVSSIFVNI